MWLVRTARIENANLGRAYATTGFIGADTIGEIVVGRTKRVGAVVTHPGAARASRDLKAHAAIGIAGRNHLACIGDEEKSDSG